MDFVRWFKNQGYISEISKSVFLDVFTMDDKQFVLTKRIAKHGRQAVIIIPKILEEDLKPGTIVKMTLDILKKPSGFLGHRKSEGFSRVIKKKAEVEG